ncbi:hypothetical protein SAMN04487949_2420 [Halogranum gelatinilyticum]|uniref:Uncharacterized protein n=1 Tax=Halogranum gelatinilyticum TaxID=660521 RepID=A0A1G9VKZ9_9EURY|nr:hypothetical protein [Halogranum gelatinilyticum]SDM72864.1 hypothetical protein SAMN04487949_2420 [Halogranum gelatinilyticum]
MTETVHELSRRRTLTNVFAVVVGILSFAVFVLFGNEIALVVGFHALLLGTSTAVVTYCLTQFTGVLLGEGDEDEGDQKSTTSFRDRWWQIFSGKALETDSDVKVDTGWLIGRLENILVMTLVVAGQYTALSIIFAAKSWVRKEDTASGNTTYYLAGTLVNFTYSIVVGLTAVWVLGMVSTN